MQSRHTISATRITNHFSDRRSKEQMATKAAKAKKTTATKTPKKKGLTVKQEAERERLESLIELNQNRIASGLAANGEPLTEKQLETTKQIIKAQRDKLLEIEALL
jgi:phosphate starvation-inducible protein PhoH